ncbi:sulfur carrier protein ThiS [Corynebacterium mendelii]|uniref:Sulfur carrier protein ThiS n=1 Tax=Corynebacterium mendelii TaxID=2765362 RepID=A0A939DZT3_9CORY|nr:sulfur carrier protein ThiS [Corynebacterium mendelii]MBN9643856.1 sulfur carrier protein ThiS [Corynebacterium mendelii]
MDNTITITLNGETTVIAAHTTVAGLIDQRGISPDGTAVAVGETVLPRSRWKDNRLRPGDTVEILTAVQGG